MPIYEYRCKECGEDFEYLVLGKPDPVCTACESRKVIRLMSACGFVSKDGSGQSVSSSAGASCGGCTANSCAGCGN